jgi:hypothetical protein
MSSDVPQLAVFSLTLTMAIGCPEAEKPETKVESIHPISGDWSVSRLDGACYEMTWENGDSLEFCYEYPQFSFTATDLADGTIAVSNIDGTIHFLTIATYAGEEPSIETAVMEIMDLRLEVVSEGAEYTITADINEEGVFTENYLTLNCTLTAAGELDCDLDEGAEDEDEIFPMFSLVLAPSL